MSDSLSVPMTGGISDSQLLLSLCVVVVGVVLCRWLYRQAAIQDTSDSLAELNKRALRNAELLRQIDTGEYRVPPEKALRAMRELFPESPRWKKAKEIA